MTNSKQISRFKIQILILLVCSWFLVLGPSQVSAQQQCSQFKQFSEEWYECTGVKLDTRAPISELGTIDNPLVGKYRGPGGISNLLNNVVSLIFIIAGILVFFFLLFGGIKWIVSGGDAKKTEEARNMITAAIVGLAIVALAWAIVKVLEQFFGLPLTGGAIPTP
ncbi:MAG: pilin [bacterium]|nr:pilin [bacterium]